MVEVDEILASVLRYVLHNDSPPVLETFNALYAVDKTYFPLVSKAGGPIPFLEQYCDFLKVSPQPKGKATIDLSLAVPLCTDIECNCEGLHVCDHWPGRASTCLLCREDVRSLPANTALLDKYPVLDTLDHNALKKLIHVIKNSDSSYCAPPPLSQSPEGGSIVFPGLCEHYNGGMGCQRNKKCYFFHLCRRFVYGKCEGRCLMSHDLYSPHNLKVLESEGQGYLSEEAILSLLRTKHPMTALALDIGVREVETRGGDVEICVWHLAGLCEKQAMLFGVCDKHHTNLPYWWQYEEAGVWQDFRIHDIIHLEQAYCNKPTCRVKAHINSEDVIIEFPAMCLQGEGARVRRLSTGPAQGSHYLGKLATTYHWYWEDEEDIWHEFPSCVTQGKAFPQLELPSHVIETSYLNKDDSLKFSIADSKFVLLFGGMQMKEVGCTTVRGICRRPVFKSLAECSDIMNMSESSEYDHTVTEASQSECNTVQSMLNSDLTPSKILKLSSNLLTTQYSQSDKQGMLLFHPVPVRGVGCVAQQGISAADTPQHMKKYGSGIHLTSNEEYALHFSTSNALIVVEAVIGSYGRGKPGDTCPPVNSEGSRFDCCVNDVAHPEVFVVYKPNHLIPRYYVEFGPVDNEM